MCLAMPDAGGKQPRSLWQRVRAIAGFAGMLLGMLASGLYRHLRRSAG
jgi:hypothetical protein